MSCVTAERIYRYLDGELDQAERRDLERHLDGCPSCRRALAERRRVGEAAAGLPDLALPPGFSRRVMERIERPRVTALGWLVLAAGSCASMVIVIAGLFLLAGHSLTDLVLGVQGFLTGTLKNGAVLFGRMASLVTLTISVINHMFTALADGLKGVASVIPLPWLAAITIILIGVITTSVYGMRKLFLGERS
jgi:anti-sigma factor RsiW